MGKYMRKAKITSDKSVTELSLSSLGVRTRAKTIALQRLQAANSDSSCYLQLRNRRLEKTSEAVKTRKLGVKEGCEQNPEVNLSGFDGNGGLGLKLRVVNSGSVGSGLVGCDRRSALGGESEDCFGEKYLEVEARGRSTRESTPCSLIKGSDSIGNPGSSTRRPLSLLPSDRQTCISMRQDITTTREIEEFFASVEGQQQKHFTEKYNFDVVNDLPLPGRFEWVRVCS
ncbi:Cyclin-dependent kinase inhibitor [Heracleum sosnowskyi]|uniref:Cyclin-dependent kinase inhibitor n=1 Tax=Heracleum sosnowskyi TaxID=360622 RepID=A0AAD8J8B2_9APIA|nr:Cyclin-dependent kinase inhibitor [Heracleum sosnowskyi]